MIKKIKQIIDKLDKIVNKEILRKYLLLLHHNSNNNKIYHIFNKK